MPTIVDTNVTNGNTYYYTVKAVNSLGEGNASTQVAVTPTPQTIVDFYNFGTRPTGWTRQQICDLYSTKIQNFIDYTFTQVGVPVAGMWRVKVPDQFTDGNGGNNHTFSEGIGYGMFNMAYCARVGSPIYRSDAKAKFDGLLAYYWYYRDANGLMNWRIDKNGNITGQGGATDGDHDAAMALVIMCRLYENGLPTDPIYGVKAAALINAIRDTEFLPGNHATFPNGMLNGDLWDKGDNVYMPDYFAAAWYREFAVFMNDSRWLAIVEANYPISVTYFKDNFPTGYVPDACLRNGADTGGRYPYAYGYNSIRMPWRLTADYLWNGDARAKALVTKLATAEKTRSGNNPNNARSEGNLAGTSFASYINKAYIGGFMAAGMSDPSTADWAGNCLIWLTTATELSYFGMGLEVNTILEATGEMQNYRSGSPTDPVAPTINAIAAFKVRSKLTPTPTTVPTKQGFAAFKLRSKLAASPGIQIRQGVAAFKVRSTLIADTTIPPSRLSSVHLSFQPAGTAPSGYLAEIGNAYDPSKGYGWESAVDTQLAAVSFKLRSGLAATGTISLIQAAAQFKLRSQLVASQGKVLLGGGTANFKLRSKLAATGLSKVPLTYPLEEASPPATGAYGLRRLRSAYGGAAIQVRRASDNATTDIAFNGNDLHVPTLQSFLGSSDGYVQIWYDQSGNGINIQNFTAANQWKIATGGTVITKNGKPALTAPDASRGLLGGVLGSTPVTAALTTIMVGAMTNTTGSISPRFVSFLGAGSGLDSNADGAYGIARYGSGSPDQTWGSNKGGVWMDRTLGVYNQLQVVESVYDGTSHIMLVDGKYDGTAVAMSDQFGFNRWTLGMPDVSSYASNVGAYVSEFYIFLNAVSEAQRSSIRLSARSYFGLA